MYFLQVLYSSSLVDINVVPFGAWLAALLAVFMLLLSAFASGSEIAFFSLSPNDVNALDPDRSAKDKSIEMLRDDNERTLATILIANNFVNVMIIMLLNYFFSRLITFKAAWLEMLCITVLLTFLLLLFGEIMPKVFSRRLPCATAASPSMASCSCARSSGPGDGPHPQRSFRRARGPEGKPPALGR